MQIDTTVGSINQSAVETVKARQPRPEAPAPRPVENAENGQQQSNPNNPANAGQGLDLIV